MQFAKRETVSGRAPACLNTTVIHTLDVALNVFLIQTAIATRPAQIIDVEIRAQAHAALMPNVEL